MFALLVECDPGTTLGGSCLRDVQNMANHLISRCGFSPENIIITTTCPINNAKRINGVVYQKTQTFFKSFNELLCKCNDKIVVLLSGHGFSVPDNNGDEADGRDEAIQTGAGTIIDDTIRSNIVIPAKEKGIKLLLFSDTCHSGTMFDLPTIVNDGCINSTDYDELKIYSLSACSDSQLSMCDIGETTGFGGSLTTAILNLEGVLEDLLTSKFSKVINAYNKIQQQLQKLHQTVILSKE